MASKAAATVVDLGQTEAGGATKSRKKLIIIVAAALLLLGGGGAAAYLFLFGKHGTAEHGNAKEVAADEGGAKGKPPVYLSLEPFVVNVSGETVERYLQVGVDVKLSSPEIMDSVKQRLPEIRNAILLILSSKRVEDLNTLEGKNVLRDEMRDAVNRAIGKYKPAPEGADRKTKPRTGALDVLLTSFVIQ
jgi:flagellar FliL protein